jgi:hypothetical protein
VIYRYENHTRRIFNRAGDFYKNINSKGFACRCRIIRYGSLLLLNKII